MKKSIVLLLLFFPLRSEASTPAAIQHVAGTRQTIVATAKKVALYDGSRVAWSREGVDSPTLVVADETRAVVLDAVHDRVADVDLQTRSSRVLRVGGTPVAAAFAGGDPFILSRDTGTLSHLRNGAIEETVATDPDATRVVSRNEKLYVYSRSVGSFTEYGTRPLRKMRRIAVGPYASDLEADGKNAYFVFPREGEIAAVDLHSFEKHEPIKVGAVPTDLALGGNRTALSAGYFVVADPASKRVWREERLQSFAAAIGRGFLRGLIGLGLFAPGSSEFPTGVDRVEVAGKLTWAFDSSSGTLYQLRQGKSRIEASSIGVSEFTFDDSGRAVVWRSADATLVYSAD